MKARIALVDDHVMLRNGLAALLEEAGYAVLFQAKNGKEFVELSARHPQPDVVLMDINMPLMDGFETTLWLRQTHPDVRVLVLSMRDDEASIIRMLRNGARGYILKDSDPDELGKAIDAVHEKGFYHSETVSGKIINAINHLDEHPPDEPGLPHLSEKETEFLHWACTDYSYKEIAERMGVSPRTVDNYRDSLQEKLDCKGRIGLAIWAIRHGLVKV